MLLLIGELAALAPRSAAGMFLIAESRLPEGCGEGIRVVVETDAGSEVGTRKVHCGTEDQFDIPSDLKFMTASYYAVSHGEDILEPRIPLSFP